jgi:hypothetical protein
MPAKRPVTSRAFQSLLIESTILRSRVCAAVSALIFTTNEDLNLRPLVPKQPRKCYLIDSLSLALRHRRRFYTVFGT